jgi:hypothetical protein
MSYTLVGDQCDKDHYCHRMQGVIDLGAFSVTKDDELGSNFWGIKNTIYIQSGSEKLSKEVSFQSPPFFYCPFCGNRLVEFLERS